MEMEGQSLQEWKEKSWTRGGVVVLKMKEELIVAVKGVRDNSGCETTATTIRDRSTEYRYFHS
ncbi:MAG: hypothetical protein Q9205_000826 [Flavoplaca limonia]